MNNRTEWITNIFQILPTEINQIPRSWSTTNKDADYWYIIEITGSIMKTLR